MRASSVFPLAIGCLVGCLGGCARGPRPSARCEWQATTRRSLADDAFAAEDRAIRYADSLKAPHSGHFEGFAAYRQATDSCLTALLGLVARDHGVSPEAARATLARRPAGVDLAVTGSFAVLYVLLASRAARGLRRSFPLDGGVDSVAAVVATVMASVAVSFLGTLAGEWYALTVEMIRVGNGHLSNRAERIPWNHHRVALFLTGVALFWLIAAHRYRAGAGAATGPRAGRVRPPPSA
jgi:hypothetical protein